MNTLCRIVIAAVPAFIVGCAQMLPGGEEDADFQCDRRGRIVLQIPEGEEPGTTWKYQIMVEGVGTLDPWVRITR